MIPRLVIPALLLATQALSGQALPGGLLAIKKCDKLKVPIGHVKPGSGQITFMLGKDGKADTASIAVIAAKSISVGGLRSLATRQLSVCRYEMGKPAPKVAIAVVEELSISDTVIIVMPANLAPEIPLTKLTVEALDIPLDSFPLNEADQRIEERPRAYGCSGSPVSGSPRLSGAFRSQAEAEAAINAAMKEFNDQHSGNVTVRFRLDAVGVIAKEFDLIESTNPRSTGEKVAWLKRCHYVPARYHGVAVPSLFKTGIRSGELVPRDRVVVGGSRPFRER